MRQAMQRALDETVITQDSVTTNDVNYNVLGDRQRSVDACDGGKGPLRLALMNKLEKSPLPRNRGGEISVLPQNCYPARSVSVDEREDLAARQPFLSVPNHVPTPSSASKSPSSPQFRYPDLETGISRGQDSIRRFRRDKKSSITVPEINVFGAPNDVWEHRTSDPRVVTPRELTPESLSDSESPLWKEFQADSKGTSEFNVIRRRKSSAEAGFATESELPPPIYPAVVHEEENESRSDSVEMVTFTPRPPPPPLKISVHSYSTSGTAAGPSTSKLQGILKSSTSLPPSYRAVVSVDIPPSTSTVPRRGGGTTTTVAVHRVPAVQTKMPSINLTPDHLVQPKIIRQKAVEFHEQPRTSSIRRTNAPPPLNLPHSDVSSSSAVETSGNSDRSPSPWHQRVKPTAV